MYIHVKYIKYIPCVACGTLVFSFLVFFGIKKEKVPGTRTDWPARLYCILNYDMKSTFSSLLVFFRSHFIIQLLCCAFDAFVGFELGWAVGAVLSKFISASDINPVAGKLPVNNCFSQSSELKKTNCGC